MAERRWSVLDLPETERPRERLLRLGAEALADQELLACLLGRGSSGESVLLQAQRLLGSFGSLSGLSDSSVEQLSRIRGIGSVKAIQLKAAFELARRGGRPGAGPQTVVDSNKAAVDFLLPKLRGRKKEHFVALLLDTRRQLIRLSTIAIGSLSATVVHPRELFREAIQASAAAVILAHNHPSGDPQPSDADVSLTRRLIEAGALLGIEVLDHVIIGADRAVSLRADGYWPDNRRNK